MSRETKRADSGARDETRLAQDKRTFVKGLDSILVEQIGPPSQKVTQVD